MVKRILSDKINKALKYSPVVGILGPRQCGKTTLVKILNIPDKIYIDLESREDISKLGNPLIYFEYHKDNLICLDEIQNMADIFIDIKSYVDKIGEDGLFLVLGSASPVLLKQSSESMAGRIIYLELSGFLWEEIKNLNSFEYYLFRGIMPKSFLAIDDEMAYLWLDSYIKTFFQRDLIQLAPLISGYQVERLFTMLAHIHGSELNISKLSKSLDLSYNTIKNYIDILRDSFQIFMIPAYYKNTAKRLVKSPKIYLSDTGILHALLSIRSFDQLLGHPVFGFSFEGMIIYNIMKMNPSFNYSFYRTTNGSELDLVIEGKGKTIGVEIKSSKAPNITRGFWTSLSDVNADYGWVIAWIDYKTQLTENVFQSGLSQFLEFIDEL